MTDPDDKPFIVYIKDGGDSGSKRVAAAFYKNEIPSFFGTGIEFEPMSNKNLKALQEAILRSGSAVQHGKIFKL